MKHLLKTLALCILVAWGNAASAGTTRYEAENATTNLPTPTDTVWPGYSGASYLCCWGSADGQFVTFNVNAPTAGSYTLAFRYSAGNAVASRRLTINGTVVTANKSFPATANWSTWATLTLTANLVAGNNTVELDFDTASGSNQYINIDYLNVTSAAIKPQTVTLSPASVTMLDNVPAGTVVSTATVTMSDGSAYHGTLTTSDTDRYAVSGLNTVTKRALTPADAGAHPTTITAN